MTSLSLESYTGIGRLRASALTHPMEKEFEIVTDDGNLCGEGPLWDATDQALYWTDITGHRFFRYLWRERRREVLSSGFQVGGFCRQQSGDFLVTSSQGIWLWSPGEQPILLADQAEGQTCVMNDCAADPCGRVYSGSWHLDENGHSAPSFLFRVDTDGSVHIADEGICFSNGLAFSPDGGALYFADSVARCIYSYDWRPQDGALSRRRVFARIDRSEGVPDGLTVDGEGFVWCAHWFGGRVTRYDPEGRRERRVDLPAAQTSSLCFGGPNLDEIYVTSAARSNAEVLAPEGYDPNAVFLGGPLYRFRAGIRGQLKHRSNVAQPDAKQTAASASEKAL
ncbi:MAG TPA: SMP-30/gluconolactonase/LRE family protein [Acidobacteriaceae bacterium]|nr:SMP-30/gluconolactonase/LRE family protein [Acidobacteriaceae bacterium]